MKKNNLLTVLATTLITLAGCTQDVTNKIIIPDITKENYSFTLTRKDKDGKEIQEKINKYRNLTGIEHIITVKDINTKKTRTYVNIIPGQLESIRVRGKSYNFNKLSRTAQELATLQNNFYWIATLKEKQRRELEALE